METKWTVCDLGGELCAMSDVTVDNVGECETRSLRNGNQGIKYFLNKFIILLRSSRSAPAQPQENPIISEPCREALKKKRTSLSPKLADRWQTHALPLVIDQLSMPLALIILVIYFQLFISI